MKHTNLISANGSVHTPPYDSQVNLPVFADGEPTANTTVSDQSQTPLGHLDSLDERSGLSLFRRSSETSKRRNVETSIHRFTSSPVHRNLMRVALLLLLIIFRAPAWGAEVVAEWGHGKETAFPGNGFDIQNGITISANFATSTGTSPAWLSGSYDFIAGPATGLDYYVDITAGDGLKLSKIIVSIKNPWTNETKLNVTYTSESSQTSTTTQCAAHNGWNDGETPVTVELGGAKSVRISKTPSLMNPWPVLYSVKITAESGSTPTFDAEWGYIGGADGVDTYAEKGAFANETKNKITLSGDASKWTDKSEFATNVKHGSTNLSSIQPSSNGSGSYWGATLTATEGELSQVAVAWCDLASQGDLFVKFYGTNNTLLRTDDNIPGNTPSTKQNIQVLDAPSGAIRADVFSNELDANKNTRIYYLAASLKSDTPTTYDISIGAEGNGSVGTQGTITKLTGTTTLVSSGTNLYLGSASSANYITSSANTGYHLDHWLVGETELALNGTTTISAATTVKAVFVADTPTPTSNVPDVKDLTASYANNQVQLSWTNVNRLDLSGARQYGTSTVSYADGCVTVSCTQSESWKGNNGMEFGFNDITNISSYNFDFKGTVLSTSEAGGGLLPVIWDAQNSVNVWDKHVLNSDDWTNISITPHIVLRGSERTFVPNRCNDMVFMMDVDNSGTCNFSIKNVTVNTSDGGSIFDDVIVMRKEGSASTSISDGTKVSLASFKGHTLTDNLTPTAGITYYYTVFVKSGSNYSAGVSASVTPVVATYTVTYAKGDDNVTGDVPTQESKAADATFTVADKGNLAWTGHTFTGWKDQDNQDVAVGSTYTMPAKAVTLTAQWTEIQHRTITLNPNGGTVSSAPTGWTLSNNLLTAEVYDGTPLTLPTNIADIVSRDGFTVVTDGWYDGDTGGNLHTQVTHGDNIWTLYPHWTAVTLSSIEVKTPPSKVTYTAGENFDPTGLVIYKNMSDDTQVELAYADESSKFSFSPDLSTALTTSNDKVTITYDGKTVDQSITVSAAPTPVGEITAEWHCTDDNSDPSKMPLNSSSTIDGITLSTTFTSYSTLSYDHNRWLQFGQGNTSNHVDIATGTSGLTLAQLDLVVDWNGVYDGEGKGAWYEIQFCAESTFNESAIMPNPISLYKGDGTKELSASAPLGAKSARIVRKGDPTYYYLLLYSVSVTATGGSTCTPTSISGANSVVVGNTITLTEASFIAGSWSVTEGGSYASVSSTGVVTGLAAGSATITFTPTSSDYCTSTKTVTVSAAPTPTDVTPVKFLDGEYDAANSKVDLAWTNSFYIDWTHPHDTIKYDDDVVNNIGADGELTSTFTSSKTHDWGIMGASYWMSNTIRGSEIQSITITSQLNFPNGESTSYHFFLCLEATDGELWAYDLGRCAEYVPHEVKNTDFYNTGWVKPTTPIGTDFNTKIFKNLLIFFSPIEQNFSGTFYAKDLKVTTTASAYEGVKIVRKEGSAPTGPNDGTQVYLGTASKCTDDASAFTQGTTYYYAAYSYVGSTYATTAPKWSFTVPAPVAKHHVTYAKGDVTCDITLPTQADVEENATFKVADAVACDGYTFAGWSDGTKTYAAGATYTMGTSNVTLTAQWTETPAHDYAKSVDFMAAAHANPQPDVTEFLTANNYTMSSTGGTVSWDTNLYGHVDCGLKVDGNSRTFSFWVPANKWVSIQVGTLVNYSGGSATLVMTDENDAQIGQTQYISANTSPVYSTTQATQFAITTPNSGWNVIHKIMIGRKISFTANGGSGTMDAMAVPEGDEYILPACGFTAPTSEKYGYVYIFNGWKLDGDDNTYDPGDVSTMGNTDLTYVAQWEELAPPILPRVTNLTATGDAANPATVNLSWMIPGYVDLSTATAPYVATGDGSDANPEFTLQDDGFSLDISCKLLNCGNSGVGFPISSGVVESVVESMSFEYKVTFLNSACWMWGGAGYGNYAFNWQDYGNTDYGGKLKGDKTEWTPASCSMNYSYWEGAKHSEEDNQIAILINANANYDNAQTFSVRNVRYHVKNTVDISGVKILRKKDSASTSDTDGDVVFDSGIGFSATDNLTEGYGTYYYTAFTYPTADAPARYDRQDSVVVTYEYKAPVGATNIFTNNNGDNSWSNKDNWSATHVALATEDVIIAANCSIPDKTAAVANRVVIKENVKLIISSQASLVVAGAIQSGENYTSNLSATTADQILIQSSASGNGALIFNNEDGNTQATIEMYSKSYKVGNKSYWQYVGIPLAETTMDESFGSATTWLYTEPNGWIRKRGTDGLNAFAGYGLSGNTVGTTFTFKGNLASTANPKITLTNTTGGINMIANSWTAPIDLTKMTTDDFGAGLEATVYIYNTGRNDERDGDEMGANPGQWLSIPVKGSQTEGYDGLKVIPAMQAFDVIFATDATESSATITLDYDRVVRGIDTENNNINEPLRAPARRNASQAIDPKDVASMRIAVADSKTKATIYLLEHMGFSDDFDNGWDARYQDCDGRSAMLYANSELGNMTFLAKQDIEGTTLGFAPGTENMYTFTFFYNGADNYYLNDVKLQQSTLISSDNEYSFTTTGTETNRFYISRTPLQQNTPTNTFDVKVDDQAKKIIYNEHFFIIHHGKLFDGQGKLVK